MKSFTFIIYLSFTLSAAAGNLYYYEDGEGVLHLTDEPPAARSYSVMKWPTENVIRYAVRHLPKADLQRLIQDLSTDYSIDSAIVEAIVKAESEYDPNAVSSKGARGLMQLMPATAESLGVSDPHNPTENLRGGIRHLQRLLKNYNNNLELAAAAYNAGEKAVSKYKGVPPFAETVDYVKKVRKYYDAFKERATRSARMDAFSSSTYAP